MTIEKIIMVTGSKGGGGKTPVAVAIALALHEQGIPVLACDFNFNNHDLYTIFHGTNVAERKNKGWLREILIDTEQFLRIDGSFWLNRWHSTIDLGLPSTNMMWEKIEYLTTIKFESELQPRVMIFDTNLTLPLICPPTMKLQEYNLPPVEVFHLWSPSIVLQMDEQERFVKAMDLLNRFSPGFEQRMTHIFTPRHYQSTSIRGTLSSLARGEFNITSKVKLKQQAPKPITFQELKDVLFANFLPDILNIQARQDLDIEDLLTRWFDNIIENLEKREYKTSNVLIIPTVVHNIALLVEKLTLKPRRQLDTIKEDLGSLYSTLVSYLEE